MLRALAACRSNALGALATEALWDCDVEARELVVWNAPSTDEVRAKLDAMHDDVLEDVLEDEEVRATVRRRVE